MRTIFAKVLLWSLGTLALSLVAYWSITQALKTHGPPGGDPFWSMVSLVEDDVCRAYEEGGPERLAEHLHRLDLKLPGQHFLTDPKGRDLADGTDRSGLLRPGDSPHEPARLPDGRIVLVGRPRGGRYRFLTAIRPWFEPPNILPYYAAVVLVIILMGAALAAHLAIPLRRLRRVVDRFGRGDLAARAGSTRRDEIGALARAFDEMAGRIEALRAAERRLLQDVSHELRSPLARLEVAVELAATSADRAAALGRIRRDVDRLSMLVGELLQLARVEGDPASRSREEFRLDDQHRDVVEDCAVEARAKGCRVDLDAGGPCVVRGEPELIRRAVENVARNAVRHAPEGTAVEVALSRRDGRASIAVRDRGPGVPEAMLASIFEPFVRVEGHRSRASGGVGLGLSIARRAVELHGGTISARPVDPGLLVAIDLPAEADGAPAPA